MKNLEFPTWMSPYRAPLKGLGQVWWIWGEKIAFYSPQQVEDHNFSSSYLQNLAEAFQYYAVLWFKLAHIIKTRSIWKFQHSSSRPAQEFSLASCVSALFQPQSQNNQKFGILDNNCCGSLVFCPLFAAFLFCHEGYSLANLAQQPGGTPRPSYQNLLTGGTPRPWWMAFLDRWVQVYH